jgi:YebC/PmpR family DNA-binding regulatory protein
MSGHNKWSKIKHKKAITDAQKSKAFSKLVRLIQVESKKAKGDVNSPGLKMAIDKAKKENMPKDNIEKAIKKGASDTGASMDAVTYEAYGPGGVALMIEALTDNKNRTSAEIRHILSQNGLALSSPGSASWAFENKEPKTFVEIDEEDAEKLDSLMETLGEQEDVQEIYNNKK